MKLELCTLSGGYGAKLVIDGVSLTIRDRSIVTLLGPNGCGKSTLLKMIGRILKPRSGEVLLDGKSVNRIDTAQLARRLALLPQQQHSSPDLTVEELVMLGRFPHRRGPWTASPRDREAVDKALNMTRLQGLRHRLTRTLSGGERQRTWIAMTLAQEPELLLLDEPTTFLDICCQFEIVELVRSLNRQFGITVIMVLHDLNLAASCSDELIMLKDRAIRYAGPPREVMTPEILREVFSIESRITWSPEGVPCCMALGSTRPAESSC